MPVSRRAQWMRAEADSSTHRELGKTTEALIFIMRVKVTIRRKIRQDNEMPATGGRLPPLRVNGLEKGLREEQEFGAEDKHADQHGGNTRDHNHARLDILGGFGKRIVFGAEQIHHIF